MTPQVAAAASAARALREQAKGHKRAAAFHRRGAQQCMRALAQLEKDCAAHGIKLIVEGEDPKEGSWPSSKKH